MGEAYNDDPAKVPGSDPVVFAAQLWTGERPFRFVERRVQCGYEAPAYRALTNLRRFGLANDIDAEIADESSAQFDRYAETMTKPGRGALGMGGVEMMSGRPVSRFCTECRASDHVDNGRKSANRRRTEGFGGDDARTSIFDYWVDAGVREVGERAQLRWRSDFRPGRSAEELYSRLINLAGNRFRDGKFFPLNPANRENERFGRLPGEQASGHWLYAFFARSVDRPAFLVVANLHPETGCAMSAS